MSSAICINLDQSKILSSGNGLIESISFAADKISRSRSQIIGNVLDRVENMVEKGENAGNQYFLLAFPTMLTKD